jgi:hypothetical protein
MYSPMDKLIITLDIERRIDSHLLFEWKGLGRLNGEGSIIAVVITASARCIYINSPPAQAQACSMPPVAVDTVTAMILAIGELDNRPSSS